MLTGGREPGEESVASRPAMVRAIAHQVGFGPPGSALVKRTATYCERSRFVTGTAAGDGLLILTRVADGPTLVEASLGSPTGTGWSGPQEIDINLRRPLVWQQYPESGPRGTLYVPRNPGRHRVAVFARGRDLDPVGGGISFRRTHRLEHYFFRFTEL